MVKRIIVANYAVTAVSLLATIILQVGMATRTYYPLGDSAILIFLAFNAALWLAIVFWRRDNG